MKTVQLFLLALILNCSHTYAQSTNIPDAAFRAYLQAHYPSSMDGDRLNATEEILSVTHLDLESMNIHDLSGIERFSNLKDLFCAKNHLTTFPVLPSSLTGLYSDHNELSDLRCLSGSNVVTFSCTNNHIQQLEGLPTSIQHLNCSDNPIQVLDALPPSLTVFLCNHTGISVLPALPPSLYSFSAAHNRLVALPGIPAHLNCMDITDNRITCIPPLPEGFKELRCDSNQLSLLPLLPSSLRILSCASNQFFALPPLPDHLSILYCRNNQLHALPTLPNSLRELEASQNPVSCLPNIPTYLNFSSDIGTILCSEDGFSEKQTTAVTGMNTADVNAFSLSPNPTNGQVNLSFNTALSGDVHLLNNEGMLIHSQTVNMQDKLSFDLSAMPKGIYTVQIQTNDKLLTKKLILN